MKVIAGKLTDAENAVIMGIFPMICGRAKRRCPRPRPSFDASDLVSAGVVAVAEALIEFRTRPVENVECVLMHRATRAMGELTLRSWRPYSVPRNMLWKLIKNQTSEAMRIRLMATRASLKRADARELARTGRSGRGVLPPREAAPEPEDCPELESLQAAISKVIASYRGRERLAAELIAAERLPVRGDYKLSLAEIAAASGMPVRRVQLLERNVIARVAKAVNVWRLGHLPADLVARAASQYGGHQAQAAVLIAAGLIAGEGLSPSLAWIAERTGTTLRECRGIRAAVLREAGKADAA